jgi:hypothetical protein
MAKADHEVARGVVIAGQLVDGDSERLQFLGAFKEAEQVEQALDSLALV